MTAASRRHAPAVRALAPGAPAIVSILAASLLGGCRTPEEKMTPAQFIEANSTLLQQLRSYDDSEQRRGIGRIRGLPREQGIAVILYILSDPKLEDYRVEVVLARILADWKDPRAIGYLLRNLTVQDRGAARRASEGLMVFGDEPRVIDALGELLAGAAASDRRIAAETLSRMTSPRVPQMFMDRYRAEPDPEVRGILLVTVVNSREPRRKEFLIDALTDADLALRALAWEALRKYRDLPPTDYAPDGPLEERAEKVAELRIWLKQNRRR